MKECINLSDWLYYDETSPSGLRWKVAIYSGAHLKRLNVAKGQPAGRKDPEGYWTVALKGRRYRNHKVILELFGHVFTKEDFIDHIDGNPSNNVLTNLRKVCILTNAHNHKMHFDNSSGKTGVCWSVDRRRGKFYAKAHWHNIEGKQTRKCFSVRKYGLLPAFALACAHRDKMIKELNEQGANYTPRHGSSASQ